MDSSEGNNRDENIKGSLEADGLAKESVICIRKGHHGDDELGANRMAKYDGHCFSWKSEQWLLLYGSLAPKPTDFSFPGLLR
jgi:hypothetical protein